MFTNKTVLIVDDEEQARLYLANILSELYPEITIQLASTPTEALFYITKSKIDLALFDVEMPGITGLELMKRLVDEKSTTKVICVSAYKRADFIQQALRLRAVDYLDKPVDPIELDEAIKKVFDEQTELVIPPSLNHHTGKIRLLSDSGDMLIEPEEIVCFNTLERYAEVVFTSGKRKSIRENLENISKKIAPHQFRRVSRQTIVNIRLIKFISKCNKTITLQWDSSQIVVNKVYPSIIQELTK